ncbi:MAG: DUF1822 family protein [Moorea sp. SIO3G5]|nr:DUF1822 family protein [Moorena sp. SIO3G5]
MTITESTNIKVSISPYAHSYAAQFAAEQTTPRKGKHVYLNTLAVYAVNNYLKWLKIPSNLAQSDCWNPGLRALFDVADLVLPNIGKLECRPVLPGQSALNVPLEVTEDRIGYVAVQFSEQLDQVELLGFAPYHAIAKSLDPLPLEHLQSLDTLINKIDWIKKSVRVTQWFEEIFQADWQPPPSLLPEYRYRSSFKTVTSFRGSELGIKRRSKQEPRIEALRGNDRSTMRAKLMDLDGQGVVLLLQVNFQPPDTEDIDIFMRLYPAGDAMYLPPDLQVNLLDESGKSCMKAQAGKTNDKIQIDFSCQPEERFSVRLKLGDISITEKFII